MSSLSVPNFSPIEARVRVSWRILQSVRKEVEEKNEEKNPNFGCSYLGNGWSDFLQIWNVDFPIPSRHFCNNFGFNRIRNHGATKV